MYDSENLELTAEGDAMGSLSRLAGWTTKRFSAEGMQRTATNLDRLAAGPAWRRPANVGGRSQVRGRKKWRARAGYTVPLILDPHLAHFRVSSISVGVCHASAWPMRP